MKLKSAKKHNRIAACRHTCAACPVADLGNRKQQTIATQPAIVAIKPQTYSPKREE